MYTALEDVHWDHTNDNGPKVIEARKRWVAVLRSGEYSQLKGQLMNIGDNKRCCLGVACEPEVTSVPLSLEYSEVEGIYGYLDGSTNSWVSTRTLPYAVSVELGFRSKNPPVLLPNGRVDTLAGLNDTGTSFEEIADLIEDTYITPFEED